MNACFVFGALGGLWKRKRNMNLSTRLNFGGAPAWSALFSRTCYYTKLIRLQFWTRRLGTIHSRVLPDNPEGVGRMKTALCSWRILVLRDRSQRTICGIYAYLLLIFDSSNAALMAWLVTWSNGQALYITIFYLLSLPHPKSKYKTILNMLKIRANNFCILAFDPSHSK